MPDPTRQTVSASQVAALFDCNPYTTKFTLWHELNGTAPDMTDNPDERMDWGTRLEPAILKAAAERRNLVLLPNQAQQYTRHATAPIGCTEDAEIIDPNRGPGIIEAKNVDWQRWKEGWTNTAAPPHIELQLQAQLTVKGCSWGEIACLVGGNELRHYEREHQGDVTGEIIERATAFMQSIRDGAEPDVAGASVEDPFITARWPTADRAPALDLMDSPEAAELIGLLSYWTGQQSLAKKESDRIKTRVKAMAQDFAEVRAWGWRLKVSKSAIDATEIGLPTAHFETLSRAFEANDAVALDLAIIAIGDWTHTVRRASITTRLTTTEIPAERDETPPWLENTPEEFAP